MPCLLLAECVRERASAQLIALRGCFFSPHVSFGCFHTFGRRCFNPIAWHLFTLSLSFSLSLFHSPYTLQSPNQPTYHQLNASPNNNPTLHVMQPPQQSPSMVPPAQQQQQLSPQQQQQQQLVGGNALSFIGRSPPQNGVGQGTENGTTSDDSDDTIPVSDAPA